jgi:hypothetical protein
MVGILKKKDDWYVDFFDSESMKFISSCSLPLYKDDYMYIHQFMIGCKVRFDVIYQKDRGTIEKKAKILNYIL